MLPILNTNQMTGIELHTTTKQQAIDMVVGNLGKQKAYNSQLLEVVKDVLSATLDIYRRLYDEQLLIELNND